MSKLTFEESLSQNNLIQVSRRGLVTELREIALNSWDMVALSTKSFTMGTSLGFKDLGNNGFDRILNAWVKIIDDSGFRDLPGTGIDSIRYNATSLIITRTSGGRYDNVAYNGSDNRGSLFLLLST